MNETEAFYKRDLFPQKLARSKTFTAVQSSVHYYFSLWSVIADASWKHNRMKKINLFPLRANMSQTNPVCSTAQGLNRQ